MRLFKNLGLIFILISLLVFLPGCDLKINLNSNLNQSNVEIDSQSEEDNNQAKTEEANITISNYEMVVTEEDMLKQITNDGEIILDNITELCGMQVMVYAQPSDYPLIIVKPFDPGSDKYLNQLLSIDFSEKTCQELEISQELTDFGAHVLSPDQTKLALALETNEARQLKLLDLIYDKSVSLVELGEEETLNGGYGAMSNHFDIKWLNDQLIQYTVFKNTFNNYDNNAPDNIEKVLQVRVIGLD